MHPRMMTGIRRARKLDLKARNTLTSLNPSAFLGRLSRLPMMAMMPMQNRPMSSPGRMPAAKSPAMEVPISEP